MCWSWDPVKDHITRFWDKENTDVYNGAITEIASSPTKDLRGWFVDGTNNDTGGRTFQHRAVAVCAKGTPSATARTAAASAAQLAQQAEREYASHQAVASG